MGVVVPGTFDSVASDVWSPVASTIENVNGSTQVPFVMAWNDPPLALTVEFTKVTADGKVDVTR